MELPALLPEELHYTSVAENDKNLLNMLVKIPEDLVVFFEYACGDETWSELHHNFMQEVIRWMTWQFFQDRLLMKTAQRATLSIREHYHVLHRFIPNNLSINIDGTEVEVNSLLWGASSDFLRRMIRRECRDNNTQKLLLRELSPDVFSQVEEFVNTGTVQELWRKEQHEVLDVQRQAAEWELTGLMQLCEDILARYLTRGNVIDTLVMAHEEKWGHLKEACRKFINGLEVGVHFEPVASDHLSLEFIDFREDALEIFEALRFHVTHLVCGHKLTEQAPFSDVINRCPNLICLDISFSNSFSDRLLDIPDTLEEIDISKCAWLSDKNFRQLVEICPNLKKISLGSNSQISYSGWGVLRQWERLEKLDISNCYHIKDDDFKIILPACRHVTHFSLGGCSGLSDNAFYELAKTLSHLSDLDISRCNISDGALIDLTMRCKRLVTLNLTRCPDLTEKGILECVRNAPNLKVLNITKCRVPRLTREKIKELRPFLEVIG